MKVQVAYADATADIVVTVDVPEGCSARDAVTRSGVLDRIDVPRETLAYAIFGRGIDADAPLASGDRVDITRPLRFDAKSARRRRAAATTRKAPP